MRFPSMTSISSSAVASCRSVTSALLILYSPRIAFTVSMSNSDCATCQHRHSFHRVNVQLRLCHLSTSSQLSPCQFPTQTVPPVNIVTAFTVCPRPTQTVPPVNIVTAFTVSMSNSDCATCQHRHSFHRVNVQLRLCHLSTSSQLSPCQCPTLTVPPVNIVTAFTVSMSNSDCATCQHRHSLHRVNVQLRLCHLSTPSQPSPRQCPTQTAPPVNIVTAFTVSTSNSDCATCQHRHSLRSVHVQLRLCHLSTPSQTSPCQCQTQTVPPVNIVTAFTVSMSNSDCATSQHRHSLHRVNVQL